MQEIGKGYLGVEENNGKFFFFLTERKDGPLIRLSKLTEGRPEGALYALKGLHKVEDISPEYVREKGDLLGEGEVAVENNKAFISKATFNEANPRKAEGSLVRLFLARWESSDFRESIEGMGDLFVEDILGSLDYNDLKKQPITATDVLQILLASGAEIPLSWEELDNEQKNELRTFMETSIASDKNLTLVEDKEAEPEITAT